MFAKLSTALVALLSLTSSSHALRLEIEGRRIPHDQVLQRRASLAGSSPLANSADLQYTTTVKVGGQDFAVLIDTGSSDLWVAGDLSSATQDTGKAATISYASGGATGPVKLGAVEFSGFTIPNQAFIMVTPDADHTAGQGLIGLGPSAGSVVFQTFSSADEGITVLDNIFIQNTTTPNYITFTLGRLNDPSEVFPGNLTVGEILPGHANITSQPKLAVTDVSIGNSANQHFQVLLDADGFLGPDGQAIPYKSVVKSTSNKQQATVVVDTGFSLPQVPATIASGIYSRFQGAELVNDTDVGQIWLVPCTHEVNITLKFGGVSFPVHPLDATVDPTIFGLKKKTTSAGVTACLGVFQPVSFNTGSDPSYDIIFGMAFLRNVYTLVNFGDFVDHATSKAEPYIQFLSTTNTTDAHLDFVNSRLGGVDTTNGTVLLAPASQPTTSDSSGNSLVDSFNKHRTYYIIAASVLGGLVLLVVGAWIFQSRRTRSRGVYKQLNLPQQSGAGGVPPMYQYQQTQPYSSHPPEYNAERPYDPPTEHVPYHNPFEARH
ncbi:unnamed protein product [Mycena citricolor]|uniref:Peptidase A1 domain-containing protein n=1 Tax=Mycena citricolor TaxID=2018698 RepID=A0AAD2JZF2_9AGAR|nr:unnamed protein product [Mycena citricolor]